MMLFMKTLTLSALLSMSTLAPAALPVAVDGQQLPTLAPMLERVQMSVVSISSEANVSLRRHKPPFTNDPFLRHFFEQRHSSQANNRRALGIGVVIDAEQGYILTNQHTVIGAAKIKVRLNDEREAIAELVGTDKMSDIALLKIGLPNLTAIRLGNSDNLRVGDFVVSIGDPLGGHNTVTSGLISALGNHKGLRNFDRFIQSDAGYGPGVLVNLRGELIGLNLSKVVQTAANTRIGFSTPVNLAVKIKQQLVQYGSPQRGFLAVQIQDLTRDLAVAFNIVEKRGAVITNVEKGSSADQAGLKAGDVVLKADQSPITGGSDLSMIIGHRFAGEPLELTLLRGGEEINTLVLLESSTRASSIGNMIHHRLDGATFNDIDAQKVNTSAQQGVLVANVKQGSTAWNHGVRPNDLIVSANRKAVSDLNDLRNAISDKDVLMLNIVRDNGALFLLLQ